MANEDVLDEQLSQEQEALLEDEGQEGLIDEEEAALAAEANEDAVIGESGSPISLTGNDVPELLELQAGDVISFQVGNISDDGVFELSVVSGGEIVDDEPSIEDQLTGEVTAADETADVAEATEDETDLIAQALG